MTVTINNSNDGIEVVLQGRLDTTAAAKVGKDFGELEEKANQRIVLECSGLEYISSSGLRLLLSLRKASLSKGGQLFVSHLNEQVFNVFKLTGFTNLFSFID